MRHELEITRIGRDRLDQAGAVNILRPGLSVFRRSALIPALLLCLLARDARAGSLRVDPEAAYTGRFGLEVTVCPDYLELTSEEAIEGLYLACSSLVVGAAAVGPAGATLRAGQSIVLRDGFTVPAGVFLSAGVDPALTAGFASVGDASPEAESGYKARFHLDASSLTLAPGDRVDHLSGFASGGAPQFRLSLVPGAAPGQVALALAARLDGGSWAETAPGEEVPLPAGWALVQVEWRAGAGNGALQVTVNGGAVSGLTDLFNASVAIEEVRWGAVGGALTASWGVLLLDDFATWEEVVQ